MTIRRRRYQATVVREHIDHLLYCLSNLSYRSLPNISLLCIVYYKHLYATIITAPNNAHELHV